MLFQDLQKDPLDELDLPPQIKSQLIHGRMNHHQQLETSHEHDTADSSLTRAKNNPNHTSPFPIAPENRTTPTPITELLNTFNTPYTIQKLSEMGLKPKMRPKRAAAAQQLDQVHDADEESTFADQFDLRAFTKSFDVEKLSTLKDTVIMREAASKSTSFDAPPDTFITETRPDKSHQLTRITPLINVTPADASPSQILTPSDAKSTPSKLASTIAMLNATEKENRELSVNDIIFTSLDNPPITIHYEMLAQHAIKNIQIPSGPFENQLRQLFNALFNSKENMEIIERLFWFDYCAFFQVESLHSLLKRNGLVEDLAEKLTSFFWKTPPKMKNDFFELYPHAVSYCIIKALKCHFPDSRKNLFSKQFYVRVQQLLSELLTGIRFRESFVTKQMRVLFPKKKRDIMGAMLRAKKERGYYSSDDETPAERAQEDAEEHQKSNSSLSNPRRRKRMLQRRKSGLGGNGSKKVVKQTLSEFISSPPDIKGEIDALCRDADNAIDPPAPVEETYVNPIRHSFMNRTRSRTVYQNSMTNVRNPTHSQSPSGAVVSLPSLFNNPSDRSHQTHRMSQASIRLDEPDNTVHDPRFSSSFKPDEHYTVEKARRVAKRSPQAAFSNKVKIRLQFLANANATKERMIEEKRKSKTGKKASPRLDTPELLDAMQEIRKKSKQLDSDSVAFGSVSSGMATTMCMSPLLSMSMEPPMEFASPGKRRYLKLDQGNVSNPQFFFHPSDPKKVQHHIIRHHNLWTFPDSKLYFKYSLMRQKLQLQDVDRVNTETMEELQRIDEKNKQALSVIKHEEQQLLADNTGEKLKEMCRKLIERTVGQHVKVDLSESMKQMESSGDAHQFRGTNLVVYALNHSEKLRDELVQFETKLDSIVSRKLKGG